MPARYVRGGVYAQATWTIFTIHMTLACLHPIFFFFLLCVFLPLTNLHARIVALTNTNVAISFKVYYWCRASRKTACSTQSHLYIISGVRGQVFYEPWWTVVATNIWNRAAGVVWTTSFHIPVIWMEGSSIDIVFTDWRLVSQK